MASRSWSTCHTRTCHVPSKRSCHITGASLGARPILKVLGRPCRPGGTQPGLTVASLLTAVASVSCENSLSKSGFWDPISLLGYAQGRNLVRKGDQALPAQLDEDLHQLPLGGRSIHPAGYQLGQTQPPLTVMLE